MEKLYAKVAVSQYFETLYSKKVAIQKTIIQLSTESNRNDEAFLSAFSEFIYNDIVSKSAYTTKIKVPSLSLVYKMKNEFKAVTLLWKTQLANTGELAV